MDKMDRPGDEDPEKLRARLEFLEKETQWYFSALELAASLGEIHGANSNEKDIAGLFKETDACLRRVVPFHSLALFTVRPEEMEFILETCTPPEETILLQQEVDQLIDNGTFAWALKQNRAVLVENTQAPGAIFLHVLATHSKVLGIVVGRLNGEYKNFRPEASALLTVILKNTANAIENLSLYQTVQKQNQELENTVAERTFKLEQKTEALAEKVEELKDFLFIASHDLQEPLRKLALFGERLNSTCSNDISVKGRAYLKIIENSTRRMQRYIEGLLQLSRVNISDRPFSTVNLSSVLKTICTKKQDEEIQDVKFFLDPLPKVLGDSAQLFELFEHLISNAIKFRKSTGVCLIRITSKSDSGEYFKTYVIDNGMGFDSQFSKKIFKPFERLHSQSEFDGAGMGLAVCKKIAERHGGTITAKSEIEKGSAFILRLPKTPRSSFS